MRERPAKLVCLISLFLIALLHVAMVADVRAQGGDGRSETVRLPSPPPEEVSRKPSRTTYRTSRRPTPKVPLPEMGRVTIKVSEGSSRVQIFRRGSDEPIETIDLPERSMSLIIRKFDVGSYTVEVRKPGFHDETRVVEVEKDQLRRVSIDLRPKMATLSVASNVPDARISIADLGDFERPVEKALVQPGTYLIRVGRRGYVSRSLSVDLKQPGSEQILNVILEPLRIDTVLDLAFKNIDEGRLDEAEALARDVLELNPQHARANLALGMVAFNRPDSDRAIDHILVAISNGETFSLPVQIQADPADAKTTSATFRLDSNAIRFESAGRPGLNFSIAVSDLGLAESDGSGLVLTGRSDFHGRPIEPKLVVYSPLKKDGCMVANTRRTCSSDLNMLGTLVSEWRRGK